MKPQTPSPVPAGSPFDLLDELLASGVISADEHSIQCRSVARDLAEDQSAIRHRARMAPQVKLQDNLFHQEPIMNPQDLLHSLELNRAVMGEQFKALDTLVIPTTACTLTHADSSANAAELLNAMTNDHLRGVAQTLGAMSAAAGKVRNAWAATQASAATQREAPGIIDGEAVEIKEGE